MFCFYDPLKSKKHEGRLREIVKTYTFNQSLQIVYPASSSNFPHIDASKKSFGQDPAFYYLFKCTLSQLLSVDFLSQFASSSSSLFYGLSFKGRMDSTDMITILPSGILQLNLIRDTYEILGLDGTHCKTDKSIERYVVKINFAAKDFKPGNKRYDRIKWCFDHNYKHEIDFMVCRADKDSGKCIDVTFPQEVVAVKTQIPVICTQQDHCLVPEIDTVFRAFNVKTINVEDRENVADFFEWLGLALMKSPRISAQDRADPFVSRYAVPSPNSQASIHSISWNGILTPLFIEDQIQAAWDLIKDNSDLEWISVVCWGFRNMDLAEWYSPLKAHSRQASPHGFYRRWYCSGYGHWTWGVDCGSQVRVILNNTYISFFFFKGKYRGEMKLGKELFIVGAKRTAFGAFNGKLANFTASELGGFASVAAKKHLPEGTPIDSVIYGNVMQTSKDAAYLSRHVGHRAGLAIHTPALTVNRLCGSGFQSVINGAQEILLGEAEIVLTGGTENMSQAPYAVRGIRSGTRYGVDQVMEDTLAHALVDQYPAVVPMGITAENLASQYKITRKEADEYALLSQQRWAAAQKAGRFNAEITPVSIKSKKGIEEFSVDEGPRPQTSIESLTKLSPVFIKNTGVVTAGNASGITDGAASLIVASAEAVKKYNLKPLSRIVSWFYTGVDPKIMGIGPVPAIRTALKRAGLSLKDMSLVEINEAFGVQYLACEKELGLDRSITNTNGGAISIGHPLGASGARITTHLTYELQRIQGRYAVGSACIGGGQGIAIVLERC